MRIRGFTQDDSHIFCTEDQARRRDRLAARLRALRAARVRLRGLRSPTCRRRTRRSTSAATRSGRRPPTRCALRSSATAWPYEIKEGDAAFYGPKIDIDVRDAIGRTWQLSTIQCDFNQPERFELEYVGADNARHRPIMLHRALFGSIERFFGVLVEHYAGAFPAWLAPVQVRVLPVATAHEAYAAEVADRLARRGLAGRRGRRRRTSSASGSATPSWRRSPTCSWSATTTWPTAPSASTRAAARWSAASRVGDFLGRLRTEIDDELKRARA